MTTPPDNSTLFSCGKCKHLNPEDVERLGYGTCFYPVPRWLEQAIGVARIVHINNKGCRVWEPRKQLSGE